MADPETSFASSIAEKADVETLKLLYADFRAALETEIERRRELTRSVAAIPAAAGGILALFIALRPTGEGALITVLYALGLVPFLLIVNQARKVSRLTGPSEGRGVSQTHVGRSSIMAGTGADDRLLLPTAQYLVLRIEETRLDYQNLAVQGRSTEFMQSYILRSSQVLLTIEVIYLVLLTLAAPFVS